MRMSTAVCNGADKGKKEEAKSPGGGFIVNMVPTQYEAIVKVDTNIKVGVDTDFDSKVDEAEENSNDEMTNMNELLLIHLDFIQLQSEQLQNRDKIIEVLKSENEMLKQRITRMDRRVSLNRTNNKKPFPQNSETVETGRKRRTQDVVVSGSKEVAGKKLESPNKRYKPDIDPIDEELEILRSMNDKKIDLSEKYTTNRLYYTVIGESEAKARLGEILNSKSRICLEVPQWRFRHLSSTYLTEGIEDLSDQAFDQRHHKLMHIEKKRKKWDCQRIRSQRMTETQKSREKGHSNENTSFKSLWPQPDEDLVVAMTYILPVTVFGINLPHIEQPSDFTLPWKEGTTARSRRRSKR